MDEQFQASTVALNGASVSVYDAGGGPALVFLHGNASRWQHWAPQLRALSGRFRCVAFDQIGYGASSPLTQPNSLSLMADTTAAVCRALGVEHALIVGHSMGGAAAQAVAVRHPDLVGGLVLAGPPSLDTQPGPMPELTADMLRAMVGAGFGPAIRQEQPELVARIVDEHLETDLATVRNFSFQDWPEMQPERITAPALVIAGEQDPAAPPAILKQLAERLPNAEYLELAGSGHYMNIEAPAAFNAALVRFAETHLVRRRW